MTGTKGRQSQAQKSGGTRAPKLPAAAAQAFNAANAAFRAGDWQEVCSRAAAALAVAPGFTPAAVLQARAHDRLGQRDLALRAYGQAIHSDPACFDALIECGNLLRRADDRGGAEAAYRAAITARPADPRAYLALARLEEEAPDGPAQERAAVAFARALAWAGDAMTRAGLHRRLARFRADRGDLPRALDSLRQAGFELAGSDPADPEAAAALARDLAEVLLRLGLTEAAEAAMQRASQARDEAVLHDLAELAYRFNYWAEAIAVLRRNADLRPDSAAARLALADMLERSWRPVEALAELNRAEALGPVPAEAALRLRAQAAKALGDVETARTIYAELVDEGHSGYAAGLAMLSLYSDRMTPREVAALHRDLFAGLAPATPARPRPDRAGRPLRVGMVTPDLHRQHPVAILTEPLLAHWDAGRQPLTIYDTGRMVDAVTRRARDRVTAWRSLARPDLPAAVAADGIDLLIDLSGHTAGNAMAEFAQRMAPVQLSFLGYPGSTWVPNIDWLIGDPVVTPPADDDLCSERLLRLPDCVFCYTPDEDYPLPDFAARAAARPLTFGSFNNLPKLTPRTIALWSAVLRALPDARLVLKTPSFGDPKAAARTRQRFTAEGIDPKRIDCRGPVGLAQMMAEYADIDVALDPVPYNGGTTTLQALWMGVPVLTLAGRHFVSRMGASLVTGAGLADWVAQDAEDFVARACRLTADRAALTALKSGLRAQLLTRPAWDGRRYARAFQDALDRAWATP